MFSSEFRAYWKTIPAQDEISQEYWNPIRSKLDDGEA